jgi:zinc protease
MEIIQNIPREEILDYYHKWYVPSNMTTIIVGDIDANKALALVKEKYKSNPGNYTKTKNTYEREPYIINSSEKVEKGDYNVGYFLIGFKGVPVWNKKDNYALDMAASILGDGRSSRLYQNVKEKSGLVSSISAGHQSMRDDSIFYIDADLKPQNYTSVKKSIIDEIAKLRNKKVTEQELNRAKSKFQRDFLYSKESVGGIANSIGYYMTIANSLDYYTDYVENINKVTPEDIQNAAKKYLTDSRIAISVLLPEKEGEINKPKESYKDVSKYVLDNGLTLLVQENDSDDIVSLSVFIKGGKLVEPKPGLSSLTTSTLMKGTKNRTALEISNELENSGIIISPSAGSDYFEIQLKSLDTDFDKAFEILADIINNPLFEDKYIQKAKSDILQGIKESRDTPMTYAFEKFIQTMYPNHSYGNVGEVVEKNLPKIQREDLVKFHNEYFIPENMVVSVSGKVNSDDLANKFYTYFPKSNGKTVDINALITKYQPLKQNQLVSVPKDSSAASMFLGWPVTGITNDKEFASLKVIDSLLGNGLSSRLFVNMRERKGLAYVVSSSYSSKLDNSFFVLYIGTNPENIEIAKKYFLYEIDKLKTETLDQNELEEVKQRIIGQYALSQETHQQKAHNFGSFEIMGKGFKYNYEYPELINSVTAKDIKDTANKYFNHPYIISVVAPKNDLSILEKEYKSESKR